MPAVALMTVGVPGGFNVVLPHIYWLDFGVGVEAACASAIGVNSIYGRLILPVGQLYGSPTPTALALFRALVRAPTAREPSWASGSPDSAR